MYNLYQKKLIKEIEFLRADYDYLSNKISQTDELFIEKVENLLNEYPDLKKIYKETTINNYIVSNDVGDNDIIESFDKNSNIKKLYRKIVKETHPDKTEDENLNSLYKEATENYDSNNISILYSISDKLNIKYEMSEDDEILLENEINELKTKLSFLKTTYTWKWYNTENEKDKNKIILKYIESKIK